MSAKGYTYRKELFRSDLIDSMVGPVIVVSARLTLSDAKNRMTLDVGCNGSVAGEVNVVRDQPCKSIKQAQQTADALLKEKNWVRDRVKWYYSNRVQISLLNGTPFLVGFDTVYTYLPEGTYISETADGYRSLVKRWSSGYGTEPYHDESNQQRLRRSRVQ